MARSKEFRGEREEVSGSRCGSSQYRNEVKTLCRTGSRLLNYIGKGTIVALCGWQSKVPQSICSDPDVVVRSVQGEYYERVPYGGDNSP